MENFDMIERGICGTATGCCGKMHVTDWLKDIKMIGQPDDIMEVRFKNTRKDISGMLTT
jgi:hypothetical protein